MQGDPFLCVLPGFPRAHLVSLNHTPPGNFFVYAVLILASSVCMEEGIKYAYSSKHFEANTPFTSTQVRLGASAATGAAPRAPVLPDWRELWSGFGTIFFLCYSLAVNTHASTQAPFGPGLHFLCSGSDYVACLFCAFDFMFVWLIPPGCVAACLRSLYHVTGLHDVSC